jgi:uncharacterized protein YqiB (DUF1249 family)
MERQDVESSVIESAGYSMVLEIEFENGRIYQYYDVPVSVYLELMAAESKGKYFNAHIRNEYKYQEIELKSRTRRDV